MSEQSERRSRLRIDYTAAMIICPKGEAPITGQCVNVSMDGIFMETQKVVPVGAECGVQISLQGPNSTLTIDVEGVVVRSGSGSLGLRFRDNLEWWAIFTIYAQYSGNPPTDRSLCCPETAT